MPQHSKELPKVAYQTTTRWLPPYGDGSGSRVINERCKLSSAEEISSRLYSQLLDTRQGDLNSRKLIIELPRKNGLNFLAANLGGHREALYALSREGSLFLWQRGSGKWPELLPRANPSVALAWKAGPGRSPFTWTKTSSTCCSPAIAERR